jgi:hypothetical protein
LLHVRVCTVYKIIFVHDKEYSDTSRIYGLILEKSTRLHSTVRYSTVRYGTVKCLRVIHAMWLKILHIINMRKKRCIFLRIILFFSAQNYVACEGGGSGESVAVAFAKREIWLVRTFAVFRALR